MAFDPQLQRQIMGRFATGVTVVTTSCDGQLWGMTANAGHVAVPVAAAGGSLG